jgi:hypothetical protein
MAEDGNGLGGAGDCLSQGAFMFRAGVDPRAVSDAMIASGDGTGAVDVAAVAAHVIGSASSPGGVAPAVEASSSPWLQAKRPRTEPGAGAVPGPPPHDPPPPPTVPAPCRDAPPPPTPGTSPPEVVASS